MATKNIRKQLHQQIDRLPDEDGFRLPESTWTRAQSRLLPQKLK